VPDDRVRRFDEPRPVMVQHDDGAWYTGWCEGWAWWPDGWRASVEYTVAPGEKYVRVLPGDRVQLADE
jgi:hypothetical protein